MPEALRSEWIAQGQCSAEQQEQADDAVQTRQAMHDDGSCAFQTLKPVGNGGDDFRRGGIDLNLSGAIGVPSGMLCDSESDLGHWGTSMPVTRRLACRIPA